MAHTSIESGKVADAKRARGNYPGLFLLRSDDLRRSLEIHQVQTITPVTLVQVLADSEWTLLALQACGGPATRTAVIVTFCEGVKTCMGVNIVATPAKYAPF